MFSLHIFFHFLQYEVCQRNSFYWSHHVGAQYFSQSRNRTHFTQILQVEKFEQPLVQQIEVRNHFIKSQCSRNFQNVKLRQHGVECLQFDSKSDFTWNQILVHSNSQKCHFLALLEFLNFNFSKLEPFLKSQNTKNSNFRVWNWQKWHFWTVWIRQNVTSCKT